MPPPSDLLALSADLTERLFPFLVAFDASGKIVELGGSLRRLAPSASVDLPVQKLLHLLRPRVGFGFSSLESYLDQVVVAEVVGTEIVLRGQMVRSGALMLYLAFPWVQSVSAIERLGLRMSDFPGHSSSADLLLVLQTKQMAVEDSQRLNDKLKRKSAAHEALLHGVPDLILQLDAEGRLANFKGSSSVQVPVLTRSSLGMSLEALFPPELGPSLERLRRDAVASERAALVEYQAPGSEGLRDYEARLVASPSGDAVVIVRDITERKQMERDLVTTRELSRSASRAKSEFLAKVSHELRTPMNGVLGMTELMLDTELSSLQRDYIERLKNAGEGLRTLLDGVLDLTTVEAGTLTLADHDFALHEAIEQVIAPLEAKAREKGLALDVEIADDLPARVHGDAGRVKQVLANLVGNAIKFTERGSIAIAVRCVGESSDTVSLHFDVVDTGIGISEAHHGQLFTPFMQGDATWGRKYGGAGIGLSLCKELVQLMGGAIGVSSREGQGSKFWFTVRLQKTRQVAPDPPQRAAHPAPLPAAAHPGRTLRGHRVLVVDDNETNRLLLSGLLRKRGAAVDEADSGARAVAAQRAHAYEVVFMDVQMPEMDGFEATARIRALDGPAPVIVAVTANAMAGDRELCLSRGMDFFLPKPLRALELDRVLACLPLSERAPEVHVLPAASASGFDPAALDALTGGDDELARDFLAGILRELPGLLETAHRALARGDTQSAHGALHIVKGLVRSVARGELVEGVVELEKQLKTEPLACGDAQLGRLAAIEHKARALLADIETALGATLLVQEHRA